MNYPEFHNILPGAKMIVTSSRLPVGPMTDFSTNSSKVFVGLKLFSCSVHMVSIVITFIYDSKSIHVYI
jgi:hypothetical protein